MSTITSTLKMQSSQMDSGIAIVSSVVAALNQGNVTDAVDLFGWDVKFTDHALGLEFNDKARLEELFRKVRELFPDAHLDVKNIFSSGNQIVAEWTFTATHTEFVWPGREGRVSRSLPGVSTVRITDGRIGEWSDYYDKLTARRSQLADFFTDWIEL